MDETNLEKRLTSIEQHVRPSFFKNSIGFVFGLLNGLIASIVVMVPSVQSFLAPLIGKQATRSGHNDAYSSPETTITFLLIGAAALVILLLVLLLTRSLSSRR